MTTTALSSFSNCNCGRGQQQRWSSCSSEENAGPKTGLFESFSVHYFPARPFAFPTFLLPLENLPKKISFPMPSVADQSCNASMADTGAGQQIQSQSGLHGDKRQEKEEGLVVAYISLIPKLRRQRQVGLREFKSSPVYIEF